MSSPRLSPPFHSRILLVYIFLLFLCSISLDLTVEMNKWRTLTGTLVLLSLLERFSCSVNVGANLGISGLFNPSTQYHYVRQSYPYYMDEYQYRNMDSSYLEGGQEEENEHDIDILDEIYELNEIDRQVGSPDLVDDGGQLFGDLTPLLLTSALVVGLR